MEKIDLLLVDDEVVIKKVLQEKIDWSNFGMQIIGTASSAKEGLDFLDNTNVDLIITDMKMPQMDGNIFIEEVLKRKKKVRFLVLSAYTDFDLVRQSFKLGVFDYLQKSDINTPAMNDVLTKLHNEISNEKRKMAKEASHIEAPEIVRPPIDQNKNYTYITLHFINGGIGEKALDIFKEKEIPGTNYYIYRKFFDGVGLIIEHENHSRMNMKNSTNAFLTSIRNIFDGKENYNIGVSSIGRGKLIEHLILEAEKAHSNNYYLNENGHVFYYGSNNIGYKKGEDSIKTEDIIDSIKERCTAFKIKDASYKIISAMEAVEKLRVEKAECNKIVFDVYFFYIMFLKNNKILDIENQIETDYNSIYKTIHQFDKFCKLKSWIQKNLELIEETYILKYKSNIVEIIKAYISLNLDKNLTLDTIAVQYGVSSSYITSLFKKGEGIPLKRYINQTRLEKAKSYLSDTNIKIKDICLLVGYNNPEHFSRAFKKAFGVSPNYYRN